MDKSTRAFMKKVKYLLAAITITVVAITSGNYIYALASGAATYVIITLIE